MPCGIYQRYFTISANAAGTLQLAENSSCLCRTLNTPARIMKFYGDILHLQADNKHKHYRNKANKGSCDENGDLCFCALHIVFVLML
jgi:hypothetical protein